MDRDMMKRLRSIIPYTEDAVMMPPAGVPTDFLSPEALRANAWIIDEEGLDEKVRRDTMPLPDDDNRDLYNAGAHLQYWLSGYNDYKLVVEAARKLGIHGGNYYEFGGSTGRVFRHFAAQSSDWKVWSSDFRMSSVRWNLENLPKSIRAFSNSSTPSLPLADSSFDVVTAFSVFTHIDEPELQWLLELRRILKVGGMAYISIHDEESWRVNTELSSAIIRQSNLPGPDLPRGKTVAHWREDDPYSCNVFHSRDYIDNVWGRYFEIVEVESLRLGAQAAVTCRRVD